jgi:purine-nucleoside phosphorylase
MTESLAWLKSRIDAFPEIAIVLGSGLGPIADAVTDAQVFPYEEIPGWPRGARTTIHSVRASPT